MSPEDAREAAIQERDAAREEARIECDRANAGDKELQRVRRELRNAHTALRAWRILHDALRELAVKAEKELESLTEKELESLTEKELESLTKAGK